MYPLPASQVAITNIAALLDLHAQEHPHTIVAFFPEGRDRSGRVSYTHYTFQQLSQESSFFACGLESAGLRRGSKVVLMVKPSLDFFVAAFGVFKAGVVPVLVDPGIGLHNMKTCIAEAEPEGFIGIPKAHLARILLGWGRKTIAHHITAGSRWFWGGATLEDVKAYGKKLYSPEKICQNRLDDMAAIVFTSGSTGVPKGVVYDHKNFIAQMDILRHVYDTTPGTIDLPTLPLFALFSPVMGITAVVPDMDPTRPAKIDPRKFIEAVENFGIRSMFGSPALLNTISKYGVAHHIQLPSLKRVISAGAPVPTSVLERFARMLSAEAEIYTPYGATECLPISWITHKEILADTKRLTEEGKGVCIGKVSEQLEVAIIRISDEPVQEWQDSLKLPPGQIGEIVVKGDNATRSYYHRDKATELAKIYEKDGSLWHRMGDLGYFDAQCRLWFCGRKSHRVVTPTGTLFTIPVEAIFNQHPAVYRSALVGVKTKEVMEPLVCIELHPEACHHDRDKIKQELLALASRFEHTRAIRHILFHPAFPVDIRHNSKIFREKLAVWAAKH